ncbi:hypothetical protein P9D60_00855 [Bacillus spizizenii]|nr:hypothetical protein [Bacillus spizizenii]MCY8717908.1 hypothetical protein [Bacillus sp. S10C12M]MCY7810433.1 hypothetical protein [Bacillus spizizenii]MCY7880647.1 hypothetical protein [Bacillus spizizenii]MCY7888658.1 hypothetical protein [Bacillus spizizenii]MCY7932557.1 hypothetical protein [Bacillus spizizenii]
MKNLVFKEVNLDELNSAGTDFWAGVGYGAGFVAAGAAVAGVLALT